MDEDDTTLPAETPTTQVCRNNLGQFVRGVSGNPDGRRKGSKNRTTLMKQYIDESMTRDVAKVVTKLTQEAISLAQDGDKDMLKFLLGEILKEVRKPIEADAKDLKLTQINVTIEQFTGDGPPAPSIKDIIDADSDPSE